jgi:transglutaminase-like putative cysteine protease
MDRRTFIKSGIALPAAATLPWAGPLFAAEAPWRTFEITTRVQVQKPKGVSRAWLPLPMMDDSDWHRSGGNESTGNTARTQIYRDGKYGAGMLYAEWAPEQAAPVVELTSRFSTRDRLQAFGLPVGGERLSASDIAFYTAPTESLPTDGIVRKTAREAVGNARTEIDKARAIYEWIVDNTFRDPKTRGCGLGDIKALLESGNLGGKCADLNALYVGMARAVGIPARDVYGLRVVPSQYGYKSLGAGSEIVTKAQHCRAEFFARGYGWIPVDPADVRKVVLEEPPGNLAVNDVKVLRMRKQLFGSWEMNWLAFNNGGDITLPNSGGRKVSFLMYPQAETGGVLADSLDPDNFKYEIKAREIKA